MNKVRQLVILATVVLAGAVILGPMLACQGGRGKYVGTYVSETDRFRLILSRDGTYRHETSGRGFNSGDVTTGEWEVQRDEGRVDVVFTPFLPLFLRESRTTGVYFIHAVTGERYLKQR